MLILGTTMPSTGRDKIESCSPTLGCPVDQGSCILFFGLDQFHTLFVRYRQRHYFLSRHRESYHDILGISLTPYRLCILYHATNLKRKSISSTDWTDFCIRIHTHCKNGISRRIMLCTPRLGFQIVSNHMWRLVDDTEDPFHPISFGRFLLFQEQKRTTCLQSSVMSIRGIVWIS